MVVYRIRQPETGLYYSRTRPYTRPPEMVFSKNGKTWTRLSDAKLVKIYREEYLGDCEIVEFEISEVRVIK